MQNLSAQSDFLTTQKKYTRVQTAINEKKQLISKVLNNNDITLSELNILITAYKDESEVDIFAKKRQMLITLKSLHTMSVKNLES